MRTLELEKERDNRLPDVLMARVAKEGMVSEDGEILTFEALNLNVDHRLVREISHWWLQELRGKQILDNGPFSIVAVESSADMLAFRLAESLEEEGIGMIRIVRVRKGRPRTLRGELVTREIHSRTRLKPVEITTAKRFLVGRAIFVDDFLATGETLEAASAMIEETGGRGVAACVVFDKPSQHLGRLPEIPFISIAQIEGMTPAANGNPAKIKFVDMPEIELQGNDV